MSDPIEQPLKVIRQQFQAAGGDVLNPSDTFNARSFFSNLLTDPITKSQVKAPRPLPYDSRPLLLQRFSLSQQLAHIYET